MEKKAFPPILEQDAATIAHIYTGAWAKVSVEASFDVIQYVQRLGRLALDFVRAKRQDPNKGSWFDFKVGSLVETINRFIEQDLNEREMRIEPKARWNDIQAILKGAEQPPGQMSAKGVAIAEDFLQQAQKTQVPKYILTTLENSFYKLFENLASINSEMASEATTAEAKEAQKSMFNLMGIADLSIVSCRSCVEIQQNPKNWLETAHEQHLIFDHPFMPTNDRSR